MKHLEKLKGKSFVILATTIFFHYFILTHFTVASTEGFEGVVKQVKETDKGLFPKAEISFEVSEFLHGDLIKEQRTVKMVHNGPIQFKVGKTYTVKTHKDWLCTYSKS